MADKKISALTGAATPLGGTEVLPIVQSGSTVKVSVANLTAGRSVAASELTTTGNILAGATSNAANCRVLAENATGQQLGARYAGVATHYLSVESNGDLNFNRDSTEFARFVNSNTDFALKTGNLVPSTAGKGIDFSANTGTAGMTSELLNWYEEGTWTPNQGAGLTVVGAFSSSGSYTRIGRQVTVFGKVAGATSVACSVFGVICTNLPFNPAVFNGFLVGGTPTAIQPTVCSSGILYSNNAVSASSEINFVITYFV